MQSNIFYLQNLHKGTHVAAYANIIYYYIQFLHIGILAYY